MLALSVVDSEVSADRSENMPPASSPPAAAPTPNPTPIPAPSPAPSVGSSPFSQAVDTEIIPANAIQISNVSQLMSAINSTNGNATFALADGTYTLNQQIWIGRPNIRIVGKSGNRNAVIIQGTGMTGSVGYIFQVAADGFKLSNVTLQNVTNHLIQIKGEDDADGTIIKNVILRNSYEQLIKGSAAMGTNGNAIGSSSDNVLIEDSVFEYTANYAPNYYTAGIDTHFAKNWIVRNNVFKNISSPGGSISEFAIHFWNGSDGVLIEKNLIINCDRGIGIGLAERQSNQNAIIRNNMIYHSGSVGIFTDVGIYLEYAPNSQVYNNTIIYDSAVSDRNAIEYRFSTPGLRITNNLSNMAIQPRNGAVATLTSNITNAAMNWFKNPNLGDLHLQSNAAAAINQGSNVTGLGNDIDSDTRLNNNVDVGADESP